MDLTFYNGTTVPTYELFLHMNYGLIIIDDLFAIMNTINTLFS